MNEFRDWMTAIGFNGKQVAKAGELIGMGASTAQLCYRGERRVTKTERLAMAALIVGLPEWQQNHMHLLRFGSEVLSAATKALLRTDANEKKAPATQ